MPKAQIAHRVATGPAPSAEAYRPSALLPDSGAYDPVTWVELVPGAERVSFAYAYTLDATSTTGYASVRPQFKSSEVANQVFRDVDVDASTVSGGTVRKPIKSLQLDLQVPASAGASVSAVVVLRIPPGMTHVACPAAETGDPTHPGTFASWLLTGL